ncbi:hypothetical protein Taro_003887 [Colocasia esculenta]|uniref:CCHC-type domain-containing protein n=1 Tax=Colocasia esculenta TaxID=4460 RepID=A0A843TN11_COLES|nr:hypothetical protein [Colocasia esculenta]
MVELRSGRRVENEEIPSASGARVDTSRGRTLERLEAPAPPAPPPPRIQELRNPAKGRMPSFLQFIFREYHSGRISSQVLAPLISECEMLSPTVWEMLYKEPHLQLQAINSSLIRQAKPILSAEAFLDLNSINLIQEIYVQWAARYTAFYALKKDLLDQKIFYPISLDRFLHRASFGKSTYFRFILNRDQYGEFLEEQQQLYIQRITPAMGSSFSVAPGVFHQTFEDMEIKAWAVISQHASLLSPGGGGGLGFAPRANAGGRRGRLRGSPPWALGPGNAKKQPKQKQKKDISKGEEKGECFHCKKKGHWKRNCKDYLAMKAQEKQKLGEASGRPGGMQGGCIPFCVKEDLVVSRVVVFPSGDAEDIGTEELVHSDSMHEDWTQLDEMEFDLVLRMERVRSDVSLIQALKIMWYNEATTFIFPWWHMIPNLEEMASINGLRVLLFAMRGDIVHCRFLPLLEDLDTVRDYAWGAALLAHLFHSLGTLDRQTAVVGFFPSLQADQAIQIAEFRVLLHSIVQDWDTARQDAD